jgi:hypothetical protein
MYRDERTIKIRSAVVIYVEVEANKEYAEELAANAWKECSQ